MVIAAAIVLAIPRFRSEARYRIELLLQPSFEAKSVDLPNKTMTLQRMNETYVVRCGEDCDRFRAGRKYGMVNRGGLLEVRQGGRKIEMPIIHQHIDFNTVTGGKG